MNPNVVYFISSPGYYRKTLKSMLDEVSKRETEIDLIIINKNRISIVMENEDRYVWKGYIDESVLTSYLKLLSFPTTFFQKGVVK